MTTSDSQSTTYKCSFCGKVQGEVKRLIAGPDRVFICDECVALCEQIITEEMAMVDALAENVMIQLIHTLKENDVDINSKAFIRDIGFINESLKSLLFRELGYDHPLSELVKHLILPVKSKNQSGIYTKFRADTVVEILDYLEGIEDEEL